MKIILNPLVRSFSFSEAAVALRFQMVELTNWNNPRSVIDRTLINQLSMEPAFDMHQLLTELQNDLTAEIGALKIRDCLEPLRRRTIHHLAIARASEQESKRELTEEEALSTERGRAIADLSKSRNTKVGATLQSVHRVAFYRNLSKAYMLRSWLLLTQRDFNHGDWFEFANEVFENNPMILDQIKSKLNGTAPSAMDSIAEAMCTDLIDSVISKPKGHTWDLAIAKSTTSQ